MASLRTRLLGYGLGVAAVAIAVLAFVVARGTRQEVERFVLAESIVAPGGSAASIDAPPLIGVIEGRVREGARLTDAAQALLPSLGERRALLLDDRLHVLASVPPIRGEHTVTRLPDGGLRIETHDDAGRQLAILHAPLLPVTGKDGSVIAHLLVLPTPGIEPMVEDVRAHRLVGSLTRNLAVAAALAIAVALGVGILLARRMSRPIEALTHIARGLGEGRRGERAPTHAPREVAELAQAFNGLADALERTEAARRRMVGDVAHELRTPLTRLRGQVEALRDGLLPLDARAVESLYEESLLLSRLVEDVQQLAEADSRGLALRETDVDVRELLRRAASAVEAQARQRGATLAVDCTVSKPLRGDPERLAQVLGNLLANALAHLGPAGRVDLRARDGAHDDVELEVQDDGAGIAAEHLPHVFERFYRADEARSRSDGGSGLGLAIVREIAEAHGGTATIASAPGRGTTVTVRIPRSRPEND